MLGVSTAGYYAWRSRPESKRAVEDCALLVAIRQAHADSGGRYGRPRVHAALRAHGRKAGRGRIERLMRRQGVRGLIAKRRSVQTTDSRHPFPVAPNRLDRKFSATSKPNAVWLVDLTSIATGEGWLYLAAIMDLHTREIIGWSMRDPLRAALATAGLMMATQRQRSGAGLVHPSDTGIPIRLRRLPGRAEPGWHHRVHEPAGQPIRQRTHGERLAHAEDQAGAHRTYATRDEAKRDLFSSVEGFYNHQRLHSALDYRTPDQAERQVKSVAEIKEDQWPGLLMMRTFNRISDLRPEVTHLEIACSRVIVT